MQSNKTDKILRKLSKKLLKFFHDNPRKKFNYKQIASALDIIDDNERKLLIVVLESLAAEKKITEKDRGRYEGNFAQDIVLGRMDFTSSGAAYLIVEGLQNDLYISKKNTSNALQGDLVSARVSQKKSGKTVAEVVEVLERARTIFAGIYTQKQGAKYGFVEMDAGELHVDFYIPKGKSKNAEHGQKVSVKLKDWPKDVDSPFGEIMEVLGDPKDSRVEMHAIMLQYGFPEKFPEDVENEANQIPISITNEEVAKRRDMRTTTTFTIDPHDAKDFDDALSLKRLQNGNWEVGVHIADVTHYVQPDSLLEKEAYQRATSVYLVDRVVPMLPEILSNNVCSLRPKEEKLTFSAVFEMNENAEIVNTWFGRTVTYSDHRFTYEDAQKIIEGEDHFLKEEVLVLDSLAKKLRKNRMDDGAISFDKMEVKFKLDNLANPSGVYFKAMKDSNHLIEEFMLLCNKKVSEFVSLNRDGKSSGRTYVYRIHDEPNAEKLASLNFFIKQFGYRLNLKNKKTINSSLNQLLKEVKGKPEENMIETLTMRTMSKAKYSTQNIGHYGLNFDYYSHFTSPIRRYPDMMAHRLLQDFLDKKASPKAEVYESMCKHSSEREKLAAEAERESIKYFQVKYMIPMVGQEFHAVISGVQDYGIFVEIPESLSEGLIKLKSIHEDRYYYDEKNHSIVGKNKGKIYQLGDQVLVKLVNADLMKKQLDFELLG